MEELNVRELLFTCLGSGLNPLIELGVHSIADSNIVEAQSCSIVFKLLEKQYLGP